MNAGWWRKLCKCLCFREYVIAFYSIIIMTLYACTVAGLDIMGWILGFYKREELVSVAERRKTSTVALRDADPKTILKASFLKPGRKLLHPDVSDDPHAEERFLKR